MANKNVNILLKLQDKFTAPMVKAGKITKEQQKALAKCSSEVMGFSRKVRTGFLGGVAHVAKFGAALTGLGGLLSVAGIKFFTESAIEGFNAAAEAETKLEAVLKNVPSIVSKGADAAAKAKDNLVALTDKMEETGAVAGDVTVAGLQQLATFQLTEESLAKLAPGMADLVAQQKGLNATQSDAVTIGNLIGKVMSGQTSALSRAGIIMDEYQEKILKTGTEEQRAATLAEVLKQNVGGVNEALAQTDAGKIAVATNLLGRAQDEIGGKLMHLKAEIFGFAAQYIPGLQTAALNLIDKVEPKILAAMQYISDHSEEIKARINGIKDGVSTAWGVISPILGFAVKHADTLIPAILGVTAAISSISVVADVATKVSAAIKTFNTMRETIGQARAAVSGMGGILKLVSSGPLAIIVIAIGAVIAVGVLLYKNWDTIKAKAQALWNAVITLKDKFVSAFQAIRDKVSSIVKKIKAFLQPLIDLIGRIKDGLSSLGFGKGGQQPTLSTYGGKATGTPYFQGGLTRINEGGRGEIVDLPNGTRIIPHDVAEKTQGGTSVVVNLTVQGNVIGNRAYMEQTGAYIAKKILEAQGVV
ncbi:MAG: hypothetical protein SOY17_04245 [Evtepia sp.]|nr:hypothetical protein [Evtepia sp.]